MGCLGVSGEHLTHQMRKTAFEALLRNDMGFFGKSDSSIGALTARLASEDSVLRVITGDTLWKATVAVLTIATGLTIAFYGFWRIALCVLVAVPRVAAAGVSISCFPFLFVNSPQFYFFYLIAYALFCSTSLLLWFVFLCRWCK